MKTLVRSLLVVAILTVTVDLQAQGTAFIYQGQLSNGGVPANGSYDFQFSLYATNAGGAPIMGPITNSAIAVSNGLFTTTLDFGPSAFTGNSNWLDIQVRTNGTATFTDLTPRQPVLPVPYAIFSRTASNAVSATTSSNLSGTLPATQLTGTIPASVVSGVFSNNVSFTNLANVFAGNGSGLTNVPGITQSNYFSAYDTTDQVVSSPGTFQNVAFSTATTSGWSYVAPGEFVAGQSGSYLVQYQANFYNGNGSVVLQAGLRAILNLTTTPTEITGSESIVYVPGSSIGLASRSFLVSMGTGQMLSLQMTGTATTGYLFAGSFYGQFFPGVAMTVVRIQ